MVLKLHCFNLHLGRQLLVYSSGVSKLLERKMEGAKVPYYEHCHVLYIAGYASKNLRSEILLCAAKPLWRIQNNIETFPFSPYRCTHLYE